MQLAISRDGYSGGVVRTAVITREGVVRDVITERDFVFGNWDVCLKYGIYITEMDLHIFT